MCTNIKSRIWFMVVCVVEFNFDFKTEPFLFNFRQKYMENTTTTKFHNKSFLNFATLFCHRTRENECLEFPSELGEFSNSNWCKNEKNSKGKTNEKLPDFPLLLFSMIFPSWIFFRDSALSNDDGNIDDTSGMSFFKL